VQYLTLTFSVKENLPPVHLVFKSETPAHLLRFFTKTLPEGEAQLPVQWNAKTHCLQWTWVSSLQKEHLCEVVRSHDSDTTLRFYFDTKMKPVEIGVLDSTLPETMIEKYLHGMTLLTAVSWQPTHPHRSHLEHYKDASSGLNSAKNLTRKFCQYPFQRVEIMHGWGDRNDGDSGYGNVHVCCMSLVDKPIGNYLEQSMDEIWNSPVAQDIRRSILDGSYKYCNHKLCPKIQGDILTDYNKLSVFEKEIIERQQVVMPNLPKRFMLCFDRSCNLSCPSCRTHKIIHAQGKEFDKATYLTEKLLQDLFSKPHDNPIDLMITGSGDPFASKVYRRLIESINGDDFPNLRIDLFTNGVLLTPDQWQKLERVHRNINMISVSIDAATSETYKKVRGGDWQQLMDNMNFLGELLKSGHIRNFETNFVVQKNNFREMRSFVNLCASKNVQFINFSPLVDWKTWGADEFSDQCVWHQNHPLLAELFEELKGDELSHSSVRLGALASYRQIALEKHP